MASYIEKSLLKDEKIVFETYYHWIIYFWAIFFLVAGIFTHGLALIVGVPLLILSWINRTTSEFGITNKRVVIKTGWIRRKTIEIHHSKVESVDVVQGILGRMLDWGTITVIGTGGSREPFTLIAKPLEFRRAVQSVQIS